MLLTRAQSLHRRAQRGIITSELRASKSGFPTTEPQSEVVLTDLGLDRPVYTLSVAAEILESHPRTLMMYEHLGMIAPQRTSTNRRRYSPRDIITLRAIQTLTQQHGVNLAGARYILAMMKQLAAANLPPPAGLESLDVSLIRL